jgi:hypothetical protein
VRHRIVLVAAALAIAFVSSEGARAATGSPDVPTPLGGNGHNVSFDGRIFIVRQGADDASGGWFLYVLRPERVHYAPGGVPVLTDGAFSPPGHVQPVEYGENALAICEENADSTPYRCDDAGNRTDGGAFECYDFVIIDSDASGPPNELRRRRLKVWIANPGTGDAAMHRHEWSGGIEILRNTASRVLRGIEPTVTRDGRLLVWQGHPNNDGTIDILMYATNDTPCGASGWSGPHVVSHMHRDPRVMGNYRLGERQLRAADGTPFADNALVHGAYPWIFPNGDAITFTAAPMPCRGPEDPGGCGPRRNALSVIGYPTNFGVAHIDGEVNPSTEDNVRLFFSSPGPGAFEQLPVTGGTDVWPFFGSNTQNYTELVFDDGLDGAYAAVLHMNESINAAGELDFTRTPDTSGYFNTGNVRGAVFPAANNGLFGKALVFGGDGDHVEVPHNSSLDPVNSISVEMWIRPSAPVDCDGNNNYRMLLGKGDLGSGSYSIVFEEGERFQARVRAGGVMRSIVSDRGIPVGEWSHVGFTYDGTTGAMRFYVNGEVAGEASYAPATLSGSSAPLRIGGPGGARSMCPNGDGAFQGDIDEVRISRTIRDLTVAARPGNHARFVGQDVPAQVEEGKPFLARITLQNTGTTAWAEGTQHRLGSQAPMDNATWGTGRVTMPRRVQPGETVTIRAELTAPFGLGVLPMQWQMVQDGAEWFGETSALANVEIVPQGTLPDAGVPPMEDAGVDAGMAFRDDAGHGTIPGHDAGRDDLGRDGGTTSGGADAGRTTVTGGCSAAPGAGARAGALLAAIAIVVLSRRKRR